MTVFYAPARHHAVSRHSRRPPGSHRTAVDFRHPRSSHADAYAKWLPPNGFTCKVHQLDARVGGTYRATFTNFSTGNGHTFGGKYLELVPNERIRHDDQFEDPNLPGTMITTIELKPVSVGTEVRIVQEGIPDAIPLEACYLGWQESLVLLGKLVEAEIPD